MNKQATRDKSYDSEDSAKWSLIGDRVVGEKIHPDIWVRDISRRYGTAVNTRSILKAFIMRKYSNASLDQRFGPIKNVRMPYRQDDETYTQETFYGFITLQQKENHEIVAQELDKCQLLFGDKILSFSVSNSERESLKVVEQYEKSKNNKDIYSIGSFKSITQPKRYFESTNSVVTIGEEQWKKVKANEDYVTLKVYDNYDELKEQEKRITRENDVQEKEEYIRERERQQGAKEKQLKEKEKELETKEKQLKEKEKELETKEKQLKEEEEKLQEETSELNHHRSNLSIRLLNTQMDILDNQKRAIESQMESLKIQRKAAIVKAFGNNKEDQARDQ